MLDNRHYGIAPALFQLKIIQCKISNRADTLNLTKLNKTTQKLVGNTKFNL